jgi:hypothetical protein
MKKVNTKKDKKDMMNLDNNKQQEVVVELLLEVKLLLKVLLKDHLDSNLNLKKKKKLLLNRKLKVCFGNCFLLLLLEKAILLILPILSCQI